VVNDLMLLDNWVSPGGLTRDWQPV